MRVIVDGFGGDNAPVEVLLGCAAAVKEYGVEVLITGKEEELRKVADQHQILLEKISFAEAPTVISNHDNPTDILKQFSDCSMAVGLKLLAEGKGDACVSAGSTGALVVGSTFLVKRIKGVKRAALATVIPTETGCSMLLDVGANAECRSEMLVQFAHMGSFYMEKVQGVANPKVGIINIGAEESKGLDLQVETYRTLSQSNLNFSGNIEAREIPAGGCDVLVADGFTGNVVLKLIEGMGKFMSHSLKGLFKKNALTMVSALFVKNGLADIKKKMDYTEYGGAPLLGISRPVIKAHGSSNAKAFQNAIRQAKRMCDQHMVDTIRAYVESEKAASKEGLE